MKSELVSLSRIFTDNLFRIPDYQRGYSWGKRQLIDFWEDLELLEGDRSHYTGVLTLEPVSSSDAKKWEDDLWIIESKNYTPFYVVDGQQRLTTALILIQCIIERVPGDQRLNFTTPDDIKKRFIYESKDNNVSRSYIFGYEKDNPSYSFLKRHVFQEPGEEHSTNEETVYTQNLAAAKAFFLAKLELLSIADVEIIYTKITQRFLFNTYVMGAHVDVFVAFETMNNRGKPLSYLELLKNRLIYLSTLIGEDDHDRRALRKIVNESWKTVYHYLGRNRALPVDYDDIFLSTQSILYWCNHRGLPDIDLLLERRHPRADAQYSLTVLLTKIFSTRALRPARADQQQAIQIDGQAIKRYALNLKTTVETFFNINNPTQSKWPGDVCVQLSRLQRQGIGVFMPLLMALLSSVGGGPASATEAVENEGLLQSIERYMFLRGMTVHYYLDSVDVILLAQDYVTKKVTGAQVRSKFEAAIKETVTRLQTKQRFSWDREEGFYRWRPVKYFLFEYEMHLQKRSKSSRHKIDWETFCSEDYEDDYSTVEHIYPQTAKGDYWKPRFGSLKSSEKRALLNSLGNLLALSKAKNSALSNRDFPTKRDADEPSGGYRYGSYSEIDVASYKEWTPDSILARGLQMLKFMEERWGVSLGTQDDKIKLLGLSFLSPTATQSTTPPTKKAPRAK